MLLGDTHMESNDEILKQALIALKTGQRAEARKLLIQVVKQDKHNEKAWLWLSAAVDTDKERRICLEKVLAINPSNEAAKRGIASLSSGGDAQNPNTPSSSSQEHNASNLKRVNNKNRNMLIISLISFLSVISILFIVLLLSKIFSPIKEIVNPNSPENVAKRFLNGNADINDIAPDGVYESTFGFDRIWFNQMGPGREPEIEISNIIVRDSMRPNSKEVTIWYVQRYNELKPPNDDWEAPLEEWLVGERVEDEGTVFFILESLNNRWVIWCAETGTSSSRFPDLCEY